MKKYIYILPVLLVSAILFSACHRWGSSGNTIITNSDGEYLEINYWGTIRFNDEGTDIQSISRDGYVKYRKNGRRLKAVNSPQGGIAYLLIDNGNTISADDSNGKEFVADAVKEMLSIGMDAQGRVERLYKKGGAHAVLNKIDDLKSDNLKAIYFDYLLSSDSLGNNEMVEIARKIDTQLGSDFEKSRLLSKFSPGYLKDSVISGLYLDAVKNMGSEFEKQNVLKNIIKQPLQGERLGQVLNVINGIGSDFDKSNLLRELIDEQHFSSDQFGQLVDVSSKVGSDFEKGNIFRELINKTTIPDNQFAKLMDAVAGVNSDFEKVNIYKELSNKGVTNSGQWIKFINSAGKISSDFDKSNVLVDIAGKMPDSADVKTAYRAVVKTINSDADFARAARASE